MNKIWRTSIQSAIDWEIGEGDLRQALVDEAIENLSIDDDDEVAGVVTVEGDDFVVTFEAANSQKAG